MEITEDQVETELGKKLTYGVVHKEPFVLIIPWDGQRFTLVGQYRYPIDRFSWEFPQGHFEHANILETAKHELQEETGITASSINEVATFYLAPGHHTQICHVFLATNLTDGESHPEASEEGMQTKKVSPEVFQSLISTGEILDGPTIIAFGILEAKRLLA